MLYPEGEPQGQAMTLILELPDNKEAALKAKAQSAESTVLFLCYVSASYILRVSEREIRQKRGGCFQPEVSPCVVPEVSPQGAHGTRR